MADIGKLAMQMSVNPGNFHAELTKAGTHVQSLGGLIAGIGGGGLSIGGALTQLPGMIGQLSAGAVALGATLSAGAAKAMDFIGTVGRFGKYFHIAAEGATLLTVESQRLGVETEAVGTAMRRMNLTLGKAQAGSKEAAGAFETIHLSFADLIGLSPERSMARIGDAMNLLHSEAQRTAVAQAIFGKSWMEIDPLLRAGSEGLQRAREDVSRFGLAVTSLDTANLKAMKDSGREVKMAFEGMGLTLARTVIPVITSMNKVLTSGGIEFIAFLSASAIAGKIAASVYAYMAAQLAAIRIGCVGASVGLGALRAALISTGIGALIVGVGVFVSYLANMESAATKAGKQVEELTKRIQDLQAAGSGGPETGSGRRLLELYQQLKEGRELIAAHPEFATNSPLQAQIAMVEAEIKAKEKLLAIEKRLLAEQKERDLLTLGPQPSVDEVQRILNRNAQPLKGPEAFEQGSTQAVQSVNQAILNASAGSDDPQKRIEDAIKEAKEIAVRQLNEQKLIREALERQAQAAFAI